MAVEVEVAVTVAVAAAVAVAAIEVKMGGPCVADSCIRSAPRIKME